MEVFRDIWDNWQAVLGFGVGGVGIILSIVSLVVSLRVARNDLINTNSWETYQAYNNEVVRLGRALALRLMHETSGRGLATYEEYRAYFGLDTSADDQGVSATRRTERQYLHDLASFYHQTGVLLWQRRLDRDFTLLLVGPGLEDRWAVMRPLADYYRDDGEQEEEFPYGGMYLLYKMYLGWKHKDFMRLKQRFIAARRATAAHA